MADLYDDARAVETAALRAEIERLRAVCAPFMRYLDDIRFNRRKQPKPTDAAIEERGERVAIVTWEEFYALRAALEQNAAEVKP